MLRTAIEIDYTTQEEEMARYAKALGHPVRIRILKLLAARANVGAATSASTFKSAGKKAGAGRKHRPRARPPARA